MDCLTVIAVVATLNPGGFKWGTDDRRVSVGVREFSDVDPSETDEQIARGVDEHSSRV